MHNDIERRSAAIQGTLQKRQLTRSMQTLMGLVAGIVADGHLHDLEIQFLSSWLADNQDTVQDWPGSAIAKHVREVLADGIITEFERDYLLKNLQSLSGVDFSETGSATPEVADIPYAWDIPLEVPGKRFCFTGSFLYGTRPECERLLAKAGGTPVNTLSRKVHYLVVGTNVSPHWVNTSYGRKIQQAMELKENGHVINIVHERHWLDALA